MAAAGAAADDGAVGSSAGPLAVQDASPSPVELPQSPSRRPPTPTVSGFARCMKHHLPIACEFSVAVSCGVYLAVTSGSRHYEETGTLLRCDVAALALASTSSFGLVVAVVADLVMQRLDGAGCRIAWRWWGIVLRVYLQANAFGLFVLALLDGSTLVLVQIVTVLACACLCTGVCSGLAILWWRFSHDEVRREALPIVRLLAGVTMPWLYVVAWVILTALAVGLLFAKERSKLGLSEKIGLAEHYCLIVVGGFLISFCITVFLFMVPTLGRRLLVQPTVTAVTASGVLRRFRRKTPRPLEALPRAFFFAAVSHTISGLLFAVIPCSIIVAAVVLLAKAALRSARMPVVKKRPEEEASKDGSKTAWSDETSKTKSARKKKKDKNSMKAKLKRVAITCFMLIFGLAKVGAVFMVFLFDVRFVAKHLQKDSSDCTVRRSEARVGKARRLQGVVSGLSGEDVGLVLGGQASGEALTNVYNLSDGPTFDETVEEAWRQDRRLTAFGNVVDDISPALRKVFSDIGAAPLGNFIGDVTEGLQTAFNWILSLEMALPSGSTFQCTGLRRLISASAVLGCVFIVLAISLMDLLSVVEAAKEIAKIRAGSSGSFVKYVLTIAKVQTMGLIAIQLLAVTVSSASRLKFEASGYFDQSCGYLVGPEHLSFTDCPNAWHVPVELLSAFLMYFGIAMAIVVFVLILSGSVYGLPVAGWVMQAFFGKDLKLANYGGASSLPKNTDWLGSRLEHLPIFRLMMRPLMGMAVTLGVWTTWTSRTYMCGSRQDWYEPIDAEKEADEEDEAEEDAGPADLVSWKAMYSATAKSISIVWVPVPFLGSFLCKMTTYLNEFVFLAFGNDGGGPTGEPQKIITHMQEERAAGVQALHWVCQSSFVLILAIIEFDLLRGLKPEARLTTLGIIVLSVFVLASVRMVFDITSQFKTFKSGHSLIDSIEEIVQDKEMADIDAKHDGSPGSPLEGLCEADRRVVLEACRELLELSWCQHGRLPNEQRTFLISSRVRTSRRTQVALYALKAIANSKAHVTEPLVRSSLILALHDASSQDIACARARLEAHARACRLAEDRALARGTELQRWLEDQARAEAIEEARRRIEALNKRRLVGHVTEKKRYVNITLKGSTVATVKVTALWNKTSKEMLDKAREVRVVVEAEVEARVDWGPGTMPETITAQRVLINRSWHKIGKVESTAPAPKDPHARRAASLEFDKETSGRAGGDTDPEADTEIYGLKWLEDEMDRSRPCGCCRKARIQPLEATGVSKIVSTFSGVAAAPKADQWHTSDLGTWWSAGEPTGDEGTDNHRVGPTQHTVQLNRKAWPDLEPAPAAGDVEEVDLEADMADLRAAIRDGTYNARALLNSAKWLSGLRKEKADKAAHQMFFLAIARQVLDNHLRRRQNLQEAMQATMTLEPSVQLVSEPVVKRATSGDPRLDALERLKELLLSENPSTDDLSTALDDARRADVDPLVLARAEEVFMKLVSKQQAALDLASALQAGMIGGLRSAIKKARAAGIRQKDFPDAHGKGVLEKAKEALSQAEAGAKAELRSAIDAGAVVRLERALAQGREAGLDEEDEGHRLLQEAEARLRAVEARKQRIHLLKNALDTNDIDLLKATIQECEEQDLQREVDLTKAKEKLEALERAAGFFAHAGSGDLAPTGTEVAEEGAHALVLRSRATKALRAAMFQEPLELDMLRLAIQQAKAAGVADGPDLQRAQALMDAEQSKAVAVKRVREAAGRRDMRGLKDAISRGNTAGVAPAKLLTAVNQLLDEQARVAQLAGDHGLGNVVLADVERERRELHNRVQVAMGGLRVVVRIRPLLLPESHHQASQHSPAVSGISGGASGRAAHLGLAGASVMAGSSPGSAASRGAADEDRGRQLPVVIRVDRYTLSVSKVSARSQAGPVGGKDDSFRFGAVFGPDSLQAEVFAEAQGLVQSAVDGYNVLVMSCGPSKGGKTYSMLGGNGFEHRGLIPRIFDELFSIREKDSWRAELEVDLQVVEVVEAARMVDLLGHWDHHRSAAPKRAAPTTRLVAQDSGAGSLAIFGRAQGAVGSSAMGATAVVLDGAVTRRVSSAEELWRLTQAGFANAGRAGDTEPRHVVVLLSLSRRNLATGAVTRSKLALADLAGMGQLATPDVVDAYKALEEVLRALASRQQRVPFRDHALTQVLQDCMGGSAKTLLLLALPPESSSRQDSLKGISLASCGTW